MSPLYKVSVFDEAVLKLKIYLRRACLWKFVIVNVPQAINGADFLEHFKLWVDLKNKCLLDRLT